MTRKMWLACLLVVAPAFSQDAQKQQPAQPAAKQQQQEPPDETNPPEEDAEAAPKKYSFDPLEAQRCISIGNFYFKKGTKGYHAALGRYEDASKYDPNSAEAFFRIGEVEEKLNNKDAAKIAYERAVKVGPDSKFAKEAKKKLGTT